jgi:serine/threonine protein kinase
LFELPARIAGTDDSKDKAHTIHEFQETVCKALDERFGPLTPEKIIGDYELDEGMSGLNTETRVATYPARHRLLTSTGRVMLKVYYLDIRLSENELGKQKTQILREAEALNLLGAHPNIVRCYAPFLFNEDKIIIPFEWVEGITLREALDNTPVWTIPDRLARFLQVCAGLSHAHRNGIVHRGISSENVLCVEGDRIKLVSFKLAKILSSSSTTKGMTRYLSGGKPNYLAPELFLDIHAATPKSDIYSLGVLLYELVTGESTAIPETGLSERQVNRLQAASGDVYPALAQVIDRMCAPAIGLRYNSVDEIVETLQSLL